MKVCNRTHPPNVVCLDRSCVWKEQNPFVRMQRRLDRLSSDNLKLRRLIAKRNTNAGVPGGE